MSKFFETSKNIEDWTFEELVAKCEKIELDSLISGGALHDRIYRIAELAVRWRFEKTQKGK